MIRKPYEKNKAAKQDQSSQATASVRRREANLMATKMVDKNVIMDITPRKVLYELCMVGGCEPGGAATEYSMLEVKSLKEFCPELEP